MSKAFEEWCKRMGYSIHTSASGAYMGPTFMQWETWQAAESHTARECARKCSFMSDPYASIVEDAIRAAYPDAFKEV